ncbi:uncharacterized protein TNCV_3191061 [Trichonephila clavipes]|nr:uncharacterized protein TNCV_3191061 [Trichonephila clavipes]
MFNNEADQQLSEKLSITLASRRQKGDDASSPLYTSMGLWLHEGFLATDHVILNHGTWTTPELAPPLLTTTPHQREDVSALDRFNVHRCPTRRVFSGTELELGTRHATVRYLYHSATAATLNIEPSRGGRKWSVSTTVL